MKKIIGLTAGLLLSFGVAQTAQADVVGTWLTVEGKSQVEIATCGDKKFCGTIKWLKEPNDQEGQPKKDINNRNENLRDRGILGINLLKDLEKAGENEWDDGQIYNPEDGETYSSEMKLIDKNTLEVKGCVLFFCKDQIWTRVQ